jgi:hypothetical protein
MSISAMKQALDDICGAKLCEINSMSSRAEMIRLMDKAITALRQAIAEAEKQEPLVWMNKYGHVASFKNDEYTAPLYTAPVHASDISQERVDETAKRKHEWVGLDGDIPGLGLVTEEFYNGMLCAEDILRKKNT